MYFDLNANNTKTNNLELVSKNSLTNELNEFFEELINAKDLTIKINKKLLTKFENFIENNLIQIIMNDDIFNPEEQSKILRLLDKQKNVFIDLIHKSYLNNKLIIAVTGRYSAGKSSFLNSILNVNLPINVEATTAIPTYLTYYNELHQEMDNRFKSDSNYMLVSSMFGNKIMQTKFLDKITKENVKNFPIPINKLIKFFVLSIKNPLLKNKVIIDTPGIDPADKKGFDYDEKITLDALSLANVVFWVMDVDDGDLSNVSLQFLEKNIKEEQDLVIIINKIDKKPPKEIQKVINKVKQTIQKSNIKTIKTKTIGVFEFSKKDKNLVNDIVNYINNLPIEKTTPFVIEIIDFYLEQARKNVLDEIFKTKDNIEYIKKYIEDLNKLDKLTKEDFLSELGNFFKKYPNEKEFFEKVRKYNDKLNTNFKLILNMFEYDSPWIGENKYYFPSWKWSVFEKRLDELVINSSKLSSLIWHIIGYKQCVLDKKELKLKQLEQLEEFINKTINEFEEIKIKLKKLI